MSFDVSQLSGRAQEYKEAARDSAYREMTRFGGIDGGTALDLADDFAAGLENVYDDFLDMPAPEDFSGMTSRLATAMSKLATEGQTQDPVTKSSSVSGHNPNLAKIGSTGDLVDDWTGQAAKAYNTNYADQFVPTASSQYAAMSVLLNAINAEAAVWSTVRDDLDKLSNDATSQMKEAGDKGGSEWAAVLSIAAAVIAVPLTGGASAIAIPAVAAGLSVAATGIAAASEEGTPDEFGIEAGSSDKVKASLESTLTKLKDYIVTQETKIYEAMRDASSALDGSWKVFCLDQPDIADAPQHPVNHPGYAGYDA